MFIRKRSKKHVIITIFGEHGVCFDVVQNEGLTFFNDGCYLRVGEITDSGTIVELGELQLPELIVGIDAAGSFVYVATSFSGLRIVDVTDPTNPVEVGFLAPSWDVLSVSVSGQYVYAAAGDAGTGIIDISDPSDPFEVALIEANEPVAGVLVSGTYAYVFGGSTWSMVDISIPTEAYEAYFF